MSFMSRNPACRTAAAFIINPSLSAGTSSATPELSAPGLSTTPIGPAATPPSAIPINLGGFKYFLKPSNSDLYFLKN